MKNLQNMMLAGLLCVGGSAFAQTPISVKGQVVGMMDSCRVAILDSENPEDAKLLASTKFKGDNFTLNATLKNTPRLAMLSFSTKGEKGKWLRVTQLQLMLDGSPVSVKIDKDLMQADEMWQKKQARINQPDGKLLVEAGKAQQSYQEYLDYVRSASITADSASYAEANAWFANSGNDEAIKDYKQRNDAARLAFEAKRNAYIQEHPDAPVSAALVSQYAYKPFEYSLDVFEKQYAALANNPDTAHVNFIKRNIDYFRTHATGASYTNFVAEDKQGKNVELSSLMKPGKLTLIDFWASWCGPCRAAIPKVKKMAAEYADKLVVVSCSVDEKKEAWLRAEKAEAMPWAQLFLPMSKLQKAAVAYSITTIPRLALIGADGKVICITHSPEIIKEQIIKSQR